MDHSYYGFKTTAAKGDSPSITPHVSVTLVTPHNHSLQRAQGRDLLLNITAGEVLRLRNAQRCTVSYQVAKCMFSLA